MRRTYPAVSVVTVALCALALTACGNGQVPPQAAPPRPEAQPTTSVDCRSEPSSVPPPADGVATPDPGIPTPGRVPAGFEASTALLCTHLEIDSVAGADMVVADIERLEGDLGPLLAALTQGDDPLPENIACTADMELVPALWLEGRDGSFIAVHYPRDACGKTKPAVRDALEDLETTDVSRHEWPAG